MWGRGVAVDVGVLSEWGWGWEGWEWEGEMVRGRVVDGELVTGFGKERERERVSKQMFQDRSEGESRHTSQEIDCHGNSTQSFHFWNLQTRPVP